MELYVLIFLILCVVLLFIFLFLQQRPAKSADSERVLRELNAQREDMAAMQLSLIHICKGGYPLSDCGGYKSCKFVQSGGGMLSGVLVYEAV